MNLKMVFQEEELKINKIKIIIKIIKTLKKIMSLNLPASKINTDL
jgi:hypothetical protein